MKCDKREGGEEGGGEERERRATKGTMERHNIKNNAISTVQ